MVTTTINFFPIKDEKSPYICQMIYPELIGGPTLLNIGSDEAGVKSYIVLKNLSYWMFENKVCDF